jgi:alpha-1,2-rhamnosyltransferase
MQSDDVLVMLDSSSHIDHWKALDRIKQDGARLVFIVYDLIPYQYPQYCVEAHTYGFNRWISRVLDESDAVIAISHSIALEIEKSMPALRQKKSAPPVISHFLLGSDLDGEQAVGAVDSVPAKIKALFDTGVPTYIFVSTVEPRKNHAYALDAFERLWQENVRANFVIVGRLGWKFETFAGRVQGHAEFGRQLHMFNHVDDDALAFFYKNANALIFTSCVEGFGLPVVEGLQKGLPVFASDIPVFREIGVEGVEFVDIADPASLADKLARHIEAGAPRLCTPVRWLTWQESSDQLFARIDRSLMGTGSSACAAGQPFAPANLSEDSVAVAA